MFADSLSWHRIPDTIQFGEKKVVNGQELSLKGSAEGLGNYNDDIYFCHAPYSGSYQITVSNIKKENGGIVGALIRSSIEVNSPFIAFYYYRDSLYVSYRTRVNTKAVTFTKNASQCTMLRLLRNGKTYSFQYKEVESDTLKALKKSIVLSLPYISEAGYFLANGDEESFDITFTGNCSGSVSDSSKSSSCSGFETDFQNGVTLYDAGFTNVKEWTLENSVAKTTTMGGVLKPALLSKDSLLLSRDNGALSVSFDIYFDGINGGISGTNILNSVLFAKDSLIIGQNSLITGTSIASNNVVVVKRGANVCSDIKSRNTVVVNEHVALSGDVFTEHFQVNGSFIKSGTIYDDTLLSLQSIPLEIFSIGTDNITINSTQSSQVLEPGYYGDISIGDNCQVQMIAGDYYVNSITIGRSAGVIIVGDDTSKISCYVKNDLAFNENSHVTITYGKDYDRLKFYCATQNSVNIGRNVLFSGNLIAPSSKVLLGTNAQLHGGGIYARSIVVDTGAHVYKYGDSLTTDIKGELADKFGVTLGDSINAYRLQIIPQHDSLPGKGVISVSYNNVELRSIVVDSLPEKKWIKCFWELFPNDSMAGPAGMHFYMDEGNGSVQRFFTQELYLREITKLGFEYLTSSSPFNNSLWLDNISTTCDENSCDFITIMEQPRDTAVFEGQLAYFRTVVKDNNGVSYQWYRNDTLLEGETKEVLVIDSCKIDGDLYHCLLTNYCDTLISRSATLTMYPCVEPQIISHPQDFKGAVGGSANFFVTAKGDELTYQWKVNGVSIDGANKSYLYIDSLTLDNNYEHYSVVVQNGCGKKLLSQTAILEVEAEVECSFLSHPEDDTLFPGDHYLARVEYSCSDVSYQWLCNGQIIQGANESYYQTSPLSFENSGDTYQCIVSNGTKRDSSNVATVTVIKPVKGSKRLSVSGNIRFESNNLLGDEDREIIDFKVDVYDRKNKGNLLYSELFEGSRSVVVEKGQFTVTLGTGKSSGDLSSIVNKSKGLYAEVFARYKNGRYELLSDRLPLSASPFSMGSSIYKIQGKKSPISESVTATVGTMFVGIENNSIWIMTISGWKQIN